MSQVRHELARAKLTRTLKMVGRRDDGYHLLEAEMVTVDLADELVIAEGERGLVVEDGIAWTGGEAPRLDVGPPEHNLVVRALALVGRDAGVRLHKHIPPGAGLGGGSSDAAAVLRAYGVGDPDVAASLGADVPFCLFGGRAAVGGVGERLTQLPDQALEFVVVTPGFGVSTRAVYDAFDEIGSFGEGPNDLAAAALLVEPRLVGLRDRLREAARREPVLAGSGASFFFECVPGGSATLAVELRASVEATGAPHLVCACRAVEALA